MVKAQVTHWHHKTSGKLNNLEDVAVVQAIGNTPLLRLRNLELVHDVTSEIWLKLEWANPGGSVKDRPALAIVRDAIARGELSATRGLIDATSGNTGIAYAMLGAAIGFDVTLVVPGSASEERLQLLQAFGAEVILSDAYDGSNGAIRYVRELVAQEPDRYFYADQYSNPENPRAHYESTGPELWQQTGGRLTHFVAGLGTTGTLMGTGRYLRERNPDIRIVGVQPDDSFHGLDGLKHLPTAIVPSIWDPAGQDIGLEIDTELAMDTTRELARIEGLFAGISTGAALAGGLQIARNADEPAVIVVLAPDNGSKYMSTSLWKE